jgi:hypothetical protein
MLKAESVASRAKESDIGVEDDVHRHVLQHISKTALVMESLQE